MFHQRCCKCQSNNFFAFPPCWQVNGREVGQDARVLQEELQAASRSVVLKILPSYHEAIPLRQVTLTNTTHTESTLMVIFQVDIKNIQCQMTSLRTQRGHTERKTAIVFLQVFFKCHYDYDPANDNLIPCKEAALRFETGDILQIVNQDDVNWWQVEYRKSCLPNVCLYTCSLHFVLHD